MFRNSHINEGPYFVLVLMVIKLEVEKGQNSSGA